MDFQLLNELKQKRSALVKQNETLNDTIQKEARGFKDDERDAYKKNIAEIRSLGDDIAMIEETLRAKGDMETRENVQADTQRGTQAPKKEGEKLFRSLGDFISSVVYRDDRLSQVQQVRASTQVQGTGSLGGFLVPQEYRPEILKIDDEVEIVRPRALTINGDPAHPDAKTSIPEFSQGSDGHNGGVGVSWVSEANAGSQQDVGFNQINLDPNEVTAYIKLSDKVLRNASELDSFVGQVLRDALAEEIDYTALTGNGSGKLQGVIGSSAAKTVTRNTATNVKYVDVLGMLQGMHPRSLNNAVWVANVSAMSKILQLEDTNGNALVVQNAQQGAPMVLFGRPIIWTGRTPTLGTEGDLVFADFSKYIIKNGFGPAVASDQGYGNFVNGITTIKILMSIDGQPWVSAPITLKDGSTTVSPFVVLN